MLVAVAAVAGIVGIAYGTLRLCRRSISAAKDLWGATMIGAAAALWGASVCLGCVGG